MRQPAHLALTCLLALAATLSAPLAPAAQGQPAAPLQVRIGYLGYRPDPGPLLSNVIPACRRRAARCRAGDCRQ